MSNAPAEPTPNTAQRSRAGLARRLLITAAALVAILLVLVAIGGVVLRSRVLHAIAVTRPVLDAANERDIAAACAALPTAADAWDSASTWSRPLAPVLHLMGWLPQLGGDLRVAPETVALARAGTQAGTSACRIVEPVLSGTDGTNRIATLVQHLATEPQDLTDILVQLQRADAAYKVLAPSLNQSRQLAPYREQLTALGTQLPAAIDALAPAYQLQERLPWLFGMDEPRRYLLVLQNPFELRATGGFIGLVCSIGVEQARIAIESCRASETFDVPAPPSMPMPTPYSRYLRLGNYYLRDANWAPDFPTTAQRLEEFWELNGQPAADGVVAVDIYALIPLLGATGDITLDNGTTIKADQVIDSLLSRYYDTDVYRDKVGIGQLLPPFVQDLLASDPGQLRAVVAALQTAIIERHIQFDVDDEASMAVLRRQGWTGSISKVTGDVVRVVDTDVGYGGVNAFIDRLTSYDVTLDAAGAPVAATLTLTYTNRYSPWTEATTSQAVFGNCTDPKTLELERRTGCFADYLRVYVPAGSTLDSIDGLEESFEPDQSYNRTVFGGYVRVFAGEQRVIQIRYQLPKIEGGRLRFEKQSGTDMPAVRITYHRDGVASTTYALLGTDLTFGYAANDEGITIDGPTNDDAGQQFADDAALHTGLNQWQNGDETGALALWREPRVQHLVLDHARALDASGATDNALRLIRAVSAATDSGRGAFEQATILARLGDPQADALYEQAAALSPNNPLAQLMWGYRRALAGQPIPDLEVAEGSSALRRWRNFIYEAGRTDAIDQHIAALAVYSNVAPDDRVLGLSYADLLFQQERRDEAFARYNALAQTEDIYGLLAGGRVAQLDGRSAEAIAIFTRAIALAPDESSATRVGDALRFLGDMTNAQAAYERALELSPADVPVAIRPVVAEGLALRTTDPAAARQRYEKARALAPTSGFPDYAIGRLLLEQNDPAGAVPLFEAAAAKQPNVRLYSDYRDVAKQQARSVTTE